MGIGNTAVSVLLRSPLHRLISKSTALVRYRGRSSGQLFTTPVQYSETGDGVTILVGHPDTKT